MKCWLDNLANRQRLFRRSVLVWACTLITWCVWVVFSRPPDIPAGTAAALATVVGLLSAVVGFYQWHRAQDDARCNRSP